MAIRRGTTAACVERQDIRRINVSRGYRAVVTSIVCVIIDARGTRWFKRNFVISGQVHRTAARHAKAVDFQRRRSQE
jgi:hypothetical protein